MSGSVVGVPGEPGAPTRHPGRAGAGRLSSRGTWGDRPRLHGMSSDSCSQRPRRVEDLDDGNRALGESCCLRDGVGGSASSDAPSRRQFASAAQRSGAEPAICESPEVALSGATGVSRSRARSRNGPSSPGRIHRQAVNPRAGGMLDGPDVGNQLALPGQALSR